MHTYLTKSIFIIMSNILIIPEFVFSTTSSKKLRQENLIGLDSVTKASAITNSKEIML